MTSSFAFSGISKLSGKNSFCMLKYIYELFAFLISISEAVFMTSCFCSFVIMSNSWCGVYTISSFAGSVFSTEAGGTSFVGWLTELSSFVSSIILLISPSFERFESNLLEFLESLSFISSLLAGTNTSSSFDSAKVALFSILLFSVFAFEISFCFFYQNFIRKFRKN